MYIFSEIWHNLIHTIIRLEIKHSVGYLYLDISIVAVETFRLFPFSNLSRKNGLSELRVDVYGNLTNHVFGGVGWSEQTKNSVKFIWFYRITVFAKCRLNPINCNHNFYNSFNSYLNINLHIHSGTSWNIERHRSGRTTNSYRCRFY